MRVEIKQKTDVEIKTIVVSAEVRYWEDATVNGVEDFEGNIPCKKGDLWCPIIDIDTGVINNWKQGVKADIHYKVCDAGVYKIKDINNKTVLKIDGYVPSTLCPADNGYGDYIIMHVDENGLIADWSFDINDFIEDED